MEREKARFIGELPPSVLNLSSFPCWLDLTWPSRVCVLDASMKETLLDKQAMPQAFR